MNTNTRITATIIALATSLLISGCGVGEASVADTEGTQAVTRVPVEVVRPYYSDIYATYATSATIASDADAPVIVRAPGNVVELLVEEGDRVEAGQVLARLDGERLRLEMLAAKTDLQRAAKEYERNVDLNDRGLISASMFDGLKFDLAALKATFDIKVLNYGYANIRATIPGIVATRQVKLGEHLKIGQVAFRITDTSELVAYLQIPQADLPKFKAGHAATVSVASMPDTRFAATISRISPTIDARSGTFRATAVIDNAAGNLAPGMFGQFTIAFDKHTNALVIPTHALLAEDDETTVYVVNEGEVVRRTVKTGIESDGRVEILAGLQDFEQIVVVGQSGLRDGSKVLASVANPNNFTG